MNDAKYIGLDVHQATISVAVLDSPGKLVMEAILETKAETILQFIHGLRGSLHVTFEEGTCAAWLHDLLKPHVTQVLVCDPRKNALLKAGNKNDRIDARKLADLLYLNKLCPVYHGETGVRTLKELARSYLALTRDLTRVMNRLKALYRSWAIPCAGSGCTHRAIARNGWPRSPKPACVAGPRSTTSSWTPCGRCASKCDEICWRKPGNTGAMKLLRQIPSIGPIRAALLIALMQTPHRFRTKRQLWAYCGLALKTSTSGEYRFVRGPTETLQEIPGHSRAQRQPQSRSEKYLQGCSDPGRCRTADRFRSSTPPGRPRDEADDGAPHPGAQDRGHHFDRLEERSAFRRRTSETTSSLSVCEDRPSLDSFRVMAGRFFRRSGSRVSIHKPVRRRCASAPSLSRNPMPPRTTRKSDRPRVSDRTMVGTAQPLCLSCVRIRKRRHDNTMNLGRAKTQSLVTLLGLETANHLCSFQSPGKFFS